MSATEIKVRYLPKNGSGLKERDAQIIGEEIASLGDNATSYEIVEKGRPIDARLHPYLEWDDSVAGEAHRRDQAERLARSIIVLVQHENREVPVRAFHAIHVTRSNGGPPNLKSYVTLDSVQHDPDRTAQVLGDAEQALRSWVMKYRIYKDLLGPVVKEVLEELT